jgi:hypothetical protein
MYMFPAYNKLKAELERARYAARRKLHITPLYLKFASPTHFSLYSFLNLPYHPL